MRAIIETSFILGSRLWSKPFCFAMFSFIRHSSKKLKISEIVFWTKFFFLPAPTVQQGQVPVSISFIQSGIIECHPFRTVKRKTAGDVRGRVQQPDLLQLYFLVALVMINRFSFQIQSDLFSGFPENTCKDVSTMMKELPF